MLFHQPDPEKYISSINYDLQVISNLIVQTKNKNSLFIIIGDHQPPVISSSENGFETPVHIISSDSSFIRNIEKYGFTEGFWIQNTSKSIKHESIYSLLLREIVRKYGIDTTRLPEYLTNGITSN